MKDRIRDLLYDIRPDADFDESDDFWEDGYLDSLDIMELVSALEKEYNIEIDLEYIKGPVFKSYEKIEEMVRKELESAGR